MSHLATVAVVGTLDSKGYEHEFVAKQIRDLGCQTLLIDVGTGSEPQVRPDIDRYTIAEQADIPLQELMESKDRGACVTAMTQAAPVVLKALVEEGKVDGVISLGGGGGTAIGTAVMRALPLGVPKVMVSTLASGNTGHYVGCSDIVMVPSLVDVAGLNSISRRVFTQAAGAICGMIETAQQQEEQKPCIVASMFGNTTECVNTAQQILEQAGYEVLVFHSTGTGGKMMEEVIRSGRVKGILDVTTTEWADELLGATLSAGPTRLDAMSEMNVPAVIALGCLDMANYGELDSLPDEMKSRVIYIHNPQVTLVRTNREENAELGKILAEKANANQGRAVIMIPEKGISVISEREQAFYDPQADKALFDGIAAHARVPVHTIDDTINSKLFAESCAYQLLDLIKQDQVS